jgi:ParB family chromosome partitioning protein
MGHARALLGLSDAASQRHAAREVISRGLSVRDTEALVKRLTNPTANRSGEPNPERASRAAGQGKDVHTRAAEDRMRFALGTKVRIVRRGAAGVVEIDFASEAELNRIYEFLTAAR